MPERRAGTVREYLAGHGIQAAPITSVGLGSSQPLAEETNPDGSPDPEGQRFDRRVELIIRLPR
ncbi:hypothetical protein MXD63_16990 [Frankia sp. Cpl3]|uniref:hypothetical protein n=1 Tax=Parafrankia colletiae TaxID=573497 RepID=UPI001F51597D|nr:hypothetical protein [Parafrankia colletiae]MCK9901765.1 hypothetical protein [Frankia sp. Cpl3]